MGERGCEVGNDFSPQQLEAIELFATGDHRCNEIAEKVGVTPQTISKWRANYQFIDAITQRTRELLKESLPEIYKATRAKAVAGSYHHIKILLDHMDNLEKLSSKANQGSISFSWDIE